MEAMEEKEKRRVELMQRKAEKRRTQLEQRLLDGWLQNGELVRRQREQTRASEPCDMQDITWLFHEPETRPQAAITPVPIRTPTQTPTPIPMTKTKTWNKVRPMTLYQIRKKREREQLKSIRDSFRERQTNKDQKLTLFADTMK